MIEKRQRKRKRERDRDRDTETETGQHACEHKASQLEALAVNDDTHAHKHTSTHAPYTQSPLAHGIDECRTTQIYSRLLESATSGIPLI